MLKVPFHSQKPSTEYCSEAAIQMVLDYYGLEVPELKEISPDATLSFEDNEMLTALIRRGLTCVRALGCKDSGLKNICLDELQRMLEKGIPPIVRILTESGSRHSVVVIGMNKRSVYYHDPWEGPKQRLTRKQFLKQWTPLETPAIFCTKGSPVYGADPKTSYLVTWDFSKSQPTWTEQMIQLFGKKNEGFTVEAISTDEVINIVREKYNLNPFYLNIRPVNGYTIKALTKDIFNIVKLSDGLRGDGPFDVDLAGVIAGKPAHEMQSLTEAIVADLWDLVPIVGDITNAIKIFKSAGKPRSAFLQTIDTLLGVVPGLGLITDLLPANTILFLARPYGLDGDLPDIPDDAGRELTEEEKERARRAIMDTAHLVGASPRTDGKAPVTPYSEPFRMSLENKGFRFVGRFSDRAAAEAEAVYWPTAEILHYSKFKTYHLFARGDRIKQLKFGTFSVKSIVAEKGVITVTDMEGKETKFTTIESFQGQLEDWGYQQVMIPEYPDYIQKKFRMRALEEFEDGFDYVDGSPFHARRKLPRILWWRHIQRWIRNFTKMNPEYDWKEVAGKVKDMDFYVSYDTPTDFMRSTDLAEQYPPLHHWFNKRLEDYELKSDLFAVEQTYDFLREVIDKGENDERIKLLMSDEDILFSMAASFVVPDREYAIQFLIEHMGYEPLEILDMGIALSEKYMNLIPAEEAPPARVPAPAVPVAMVPGPPPKPEKPPKPPVPPPPEIPGIPADVLGYLNLVHLNAVDMPRYLKPPGFTRKVYVIPVRDEATGDIYHIFQGNPAEKTHLYKITNLINKRGKVVTVLVARDEAALKEVEVLDIKEVELQVRIVNKDVIEKVRPTVFDWAQARQFINKFSTWIQQATNELKRRNLISVYIHMESLKEWSRDLLDTIKQYEPGLVGPVEMEKVWVEVELPPEDMGTLWAAFSAPLIEAGLDPESYRLEFNRSIAPGIDFEENLYLIMDFATKILTEQNLIKRTKGRPTIEVVDIAKKAPTFTWKIADWALSAAATEIGRVREAATAKNIVQLNNSVGALKIVADKMIALLEAVKEVRAFKSLREGPD